ncbi:MULTISPECIES: protein phosphatase CheZ [Kordiimonas]|jgi:chemotaxis regulatin CheY-phosphate phosphatase CheZ|uniref:Chemotaxis phosphatase, CheZ n=1 Tax=Kordiimonas lacus TaxID=637679 RepID=A0A1G6XY88_9PROT|nr:MULTISPECIES: protein phosphatase CheZ [Kordiimonas]SDD82417.1 Chemotaxis phosphatase, CheZ [Kordiimonas lacus]
MTTPELPKQIQLLVDSLRKQDTTQLSLTDVASVTEVLIGTMSVFFKSIDTSIYRECRSLSDYISNARKEIASLQPGDLESARIPRAGLELDAIVQQTEEATNTIMEAAEEIMGLDPDDKDNYVATSQDAVMRIFEACSFQDITGQRISKVVETLAHIETRVMELRDLLGVTDQDIEEAKEAAGPIPEDKSLLSGPALQGEGIDQSEVDALLGGGAAAEPKAEAAPAPAPQPKPEPKPEPKVEPPKAVSPKELDNMFEEDFDPVADVEAKEAKKKAEEAKKAEEEKKKAEKKAEPAKEEEIDLPEGEEVSQDDIDALFG